LGVNIIRVKKNDRRRREQAFDEVEGCGAGSSFSF
jgi:hypothetical protein